VYARSGLESREINERRNCRFGCTFSSLLVKTRGGILETRKPIDLTDLKLEQSGVPRLQPIDTVNIVNIRELERKAFPARSEFLWAACHMGTSSNRERDGKDGRIVDVRHSKTGCCSIRCIARWKI